MARCTGAHCDVRINTYTSYNDYFFLNFRSFLSTEGDSYSRFILRMYEISESLNIINQSLNLFLKKRENFTNFKNYCMSTQPLNNSKMENLIRHFLIWGEGYSVPSGTVYTPVESPKGEFGVFLVTDSTKKPYRCKIRSPAYHNLQMLPQLARGLKLADLVTLIGTIDIVFGEIDR